MPQSSTKSFSGIFISYRRNDCPGHAGRLNDKLGVDLYFQNKLTEAEVSFRKAVSLGSTDPEVFNNLGNTLSKLGQHAEARTQFQEALRRDPNNQLFKDNLNREILNKEQP
jgi:Flp pilus assembly protein TadD